jgi:hypothetical protein
MVGSSLALPLYHAARIAEPGASVDVLVAAAPAAPLSFSLLSFRRKSSLFGIGSVNELV